MDIKFRAAHSADLTALVTMLANDQLGAAREDASSPLNPKYLAMFEVIENDLNNELMMVELEGQVIGMLQLRYSTFLIHSLISKYVPTKLHRTRLPPTQRSAFLNPASHQWLLVE